MKRRNDFYRSIPVFNVPGLIAVRFYEETRDHIWRQHTEISRIFSRLPFFDYAVDRALSSPDRVIRSDRNSLIFIDVSSTNRTGQPLCIPVKLMEEGRSGYVKTVFFGNVRALRGLVYERGPNDA